MKKTVFLLSALFIFSSLSAQTVNNMPLKDVDVEYIQIIGRPKAFSSKVNVQIDFGQSTKLFTTSTQIRDEDGKLVEFNSMIDALNFMSANGYDFVQAYVTTGEQNVYHYLMRKRKPSF